MRRDFDCAVCEKAFEFVYEEDEPDEGEPAFCSDTCRSTYEKGLRTMSDDDDFVDNDDDINDNEDEDSVAQEETECPTCLDMDYICSVCNEPDGDCTCEGGPELEPCPDCG